jgi:hypothetical protein
MTRHATIKRLFQVAAIVALGGLAGAVHAANTAQFLFLAQGPEQGYSINLGAKASTGAGVCNVFGTGVDVRTITAFTTVQSDILAQCANGVSLQRHKAGTNTTSADNILWCAWPGGSLLQAGVGILN